MPVDGSELFELVTGARRRAAVVGAAVAVRLGGEWIDAVAGRASLDSGSPVDLATRFRIGSTLKPLTAQFVCSVLRDAGLDLDTSIAGVLDWPGPERARDETTFRHVVTHTSGIDGTFWSGFGDAEDAIGRYAAAAAGLPRLFRPGQSWGYSNSGFVLAGRAAEILTGVPFDAGLVAWLRDTTDVELTMDHAEGHRSTAATGHRLRGGSLTAVAPAPGLRALGPAGATAFGTARDLLVAVRTAAGEPGSVDERDVALPPAESTAATHQGIGWKVYRWSNHRVLGHDGGSESQAAFVRYVPELDAGIALVANTVPNALVLWSELEAWFYTRTGITPPPPLAATTDAGVEANDHGTYECRDATFTLMSHNDGTTLTLAGLDGSSTTVAHLRPLARHLYRATPPLTDPFGIVSVEPLDDRTLLHVGPFTARRR